VHRARLSDPRLDGGNLQFIPPDVRTPEFDREAALEVYWAFGYLDECDKTEELLIAVIRGGNYDPAMIEEDWAVPDELLTQAVLDACLEDLGEDASGAASIVARFEALRDEQ